MVGMEEEIKRDPGDKPSGAMNYGTQEAFNFSFSCGPKAIGLGG
jgi:hypothetical protein